LWPSKVAFCMRSRIRYQPPAWEDLLKCKNPPPPGARKGIKSSSNPHQVPLCLRGGGSQWQVHYLRGTLYIYYKYTICFGLLKYIHHSNFKCFRSDWFSHNVNIKKQTSKLVYNITSSFCSYEARFRIHVFL
jgi:hypothetical protein